MEAAITIHGSVMTCLDWEHDCAHIKNYGGGIFDGQSPSDNFGVCTNDVFNLFLNVFNFKQNHVLNVVLNKIDIFSHPCRAN